MDRRRFIEAAGVASASAMSALAGCGKLSGRGTPTEEPAGEDGSGDESPSGERAGYDPWVGSDVYADGTVNAFSLDLAVLRTLEEDGEEEKTEESSGDGSPTDPLSAVPATYLFAAAFGLGFGLADSGLSGIAEADGPAEVAHFVGGSYVFEGSFDEDEIADAVTAAGLEEVDDEDGYVIYGKGSGEDATVVAISSTAVVHVTGGEDVQEPVERAEALIDVNEGESDRYSAQSEDFDELVTALDSRSLMAAQFDEAGGVLEADDEETEDGSSSDFAGFGDIDLDGDAIGGAVSASISETELVSSMVIQYASESEVDAKADVEAALGETAVERTVTVDGRMVYVEGTYRQED